MMPPLGWKTARPEPISSGKLNRSSSAPSLRWSRRCASSMNSRWLVEGLLRLPRGAVDALQAGVVLVAAPVGGRAAGQLERRDVSRRRDMRPTAQISPFPFAGAGIEVVVGGQLVAADLHDIGVAGLVVDELELVRLVRKLFARLVFGLVDPPREQLAFFDDLAHALLQRLEIFRRERARHIEVVVEAIGDGRSDAELGLGEHVLHRLGQHVGGGVANDAAAVVGVGGHRDDVDVGVGRPREVAQPPLERLAPRRRRPDHHDPADRRLGPPRPRSSRQRPG